MLAFSRALSSLSLTPPPHSVSRGNHLNTHESLSKWLRKEKQIFCWQTTIDLPQSSTNVKTICPLPRKNTYIYITVRFLNLKTPQTQILADKLLYDNLTLCLTKWGTPSKKDSIPRCHKPKLFPDTAKCSLRERNYDLLI